MNVIIAIPVDAAVFAALAALGMVLGRIVTKNARAFDDGPPSGRPAFGIIAGAAALAGACFAARGAALPELELAGLLTIALAGICYADIRYGLVPDVFTLGPLAAMLVGDAVLRHWSALIAVAIVAGPFALAAAFSRGRGMGWGDVKLVALGAIVLGAQSALLAFALACFIAVGLGLLRGRRAAPIAFAPYLIAALAAVTAVHGAA